MDSPPFSEKEAQNGQELLISIGKLITAWQGVEYTVCEIYLSFFPPRTRDVPCIAYHAIRTFDARATVVNALIAHFCPYRTIEWAKLWKDIRERQGVRNAVAHGMATIIGKSPNRKWAVGESPYNLQSFKGSRKMNDYRSAKELGESEISIRNLAMELEKFRSSLEADAKLQAKLLSPHSGALANSQIGRVVVHIPEAP